MSRTMETRKLKLFYFQKEARHRAKKLWTDIFLGNLSLNEGKNFVGLPVLNSWIWWRHVKTKNIYIYRYPLNEIVWVLSSLQLFYAENENKIDGVCYP